MAEERFPEGAEEAERSPRYKMLQAEAHGDKASARVYALNEFLSLLIREGATERTDRLVEQYRFTRDEVVQSAHDAASALRRAESISGDRYGGILARQIECHYISRHTR